MAAPSLLLLAACGGGGGSGDGGGALPPSFFETAEYDANFGLGAIHASSAYAEGGTGAGIKVAVIDTGIDVDHPEFAGAIAPDSINIVDPTAGINDVDGHGTAVSGVVGARRNGALTHGVAFDSELLVIRADSDGLCPGDFCEPDVTAATDYAVSRGARVINYSLGGDAISEALKNALARAVDKAILVFAAGNDGDPDPTFPGRFASSDLADGRALAVGAVDASNGIADFSNRAGNSRDAYVVAPGVGILVPKLEGSAKFRDGTSFSAPHVSGALAAVLDASPFLTPDDAVTLLLNSATDLGASGVDGVYGHGLIDLAAALRPQGTLGVPLGGSVDGAAAPLETSGLVLGPAFGPGPEVARAIFLDGYGRPYWLELGDRVRANRRPLDLLRWLEPGAAVRTVTAALDATSSARLSLMEPAAGTARPPGADPVHERSEAFFLTAELGGSSAFALSHEWGMSHRFGLAALTPQAPGRWLQGAPLRSPYLAFTDGGEGIALDHRLAPGLTVRVGVARDDPSEPSDLDRGARRAAIIELARTWDDRAALTAHVGSLAEESSLLDTTGGGALALDGASTTFLGLGARIAVAARLALFGQLSYGATAPSGGDGGLIEEVSRLHSMAFAGGLGYSDLLASGDRLAVAIAQPLRVEAGSSTFDLPVGRTFEGGIRRRSQDVDLAPDGRELDLELGYTLRLAPARVLSLNWLTRLQPGHDPKASPAHAAALKWRTRF